MARGVFVHRADSIYQDNPAEHYQFPAQYLSRAHRCEGDWILSVNGLAGPNSFSPEEVDEETWLSNNALVLLVNRYTGILTPAQ